MVTVTIKKEGENLTVDSPFNKEFVERARELGGKWRNSVWNFNARYESNVRQSCIDIYGTDGSPMPTVTMRVQLDDVCDMYDELIVGPIQVLKKWNRDSAPKLGHGCAVISGKLESYGGSRNHPQITFLPGTVIEILNVPQIIANQLASADDAYSIVNESSSDVRLTPSEESLLLALKSMPSDRLALILENINNE